MPVAQQHGRYRHDASTGAGLGRSTKEIWSTR
jgi:hypothetical protein